MAHLPTCGGGETCFPISSSESVCARYCCTDADCGAGQCTTKNGTMNIFGTVAPNSSAVCTAM